MCAKPPSALHLMLHGSFGPSRDVNGVLWVHDECAPSCGRDVSGQAPCEFVASRCMGPEEEEDKKLNFFLQWNLLQLEIRIKKNNEYLTLILIGTL